MEEANADIVYGTGRYSYKEVHGWAKYPEGQGYTMYDIGGLAVDSQDRLYAFNRGAHPMMVFDRDGNLLTSWGEGILGERAHGCCVGPDGSIYATDDGNHTVTKFTEKGEVLMVLGTRDQPTDTGYLRGPGGEKNRYPALASIKRSAGPFNRPTGVALSATGEIYVCDGYGNARVHKFTADGKLIMSWGEPGFLPGQFRIPHTVCVDKRERVWIADRENNRIQIFSSEGVLLHMLTRVFRPMGISIDEDETVYVSENRGVSIFTIDGSLLAHWDCEEQPPNAGLFLTSHSIAVDSHGDIYIGETPMDTTKIDRGPRVIHKFVRMR